MYSFKIAPILLFVIFFSNFLQAQIDPSIMAALSKLPKEESERLILQYGGDNAKSSGSVQKNDQMKYITEDDEIAVSSKVQEEQNNSSENLTKKENLLVSDNNNLPSRSLGNNNLNKEEIIKNAESLFEKNENN